MTPNLLNPIKVTIETIDKENTRYDHLTQEPINQPIRPSSFPIDAQVKFIKTGDPTATKMGIDEETDGYILIRPIDLETLNRTIKRGDKIVKMGSISCSYFIGKKKPGAAYQDQGEFTLVRHFFVERDVK